MLFFPRYFKSISFFTVVLSLLFSISAAAQNSQPLIILTSFSEDVSATFANAFEQQFPDTRIRFIHKKTPAALTHLDKQMKPRPDLVMASAVDAFDWLSKQQQLKKLDASDRLDYTPFGYSGYGFIWHRDYLTKQGLTAPASWDDLLKPEYRQHIAMSSPTRSGTTHVMVETVLQERGWREGWAYLTELAGNLATITARSFGVRQGVVKQRFGVGLVIDFFAFSAQPDNQAIGFSYPSPTTYLPVSIGIVKGGEQPQLARDFIRFMISDPGQGLLLETNISRYPINRELLQQNPDHPLSHYQNQLGYTLSYDHTLAVRRYHLVNTLFDYAITYRLHFLQEAWQLYYQLAAEPEVLASNERQLRLEQLRLELTSVPFAEIDLGDSALLASFTRAIPGSQLAPQQQELQQQWKRWDEQQQANVMRGLTQLALELKQAEAKDVPAD